VKETSRYPNLIGNFDSLCAHTIPPILMFTLLIYILMKTLCQEASHKTTSSQLVSKPGYLY
jgi:hypothetical protein